MEAANNEQFAARIREAFPKAITRTVLLMHLIFGWSNAVQLLKSEAC